MLGGGASLQGVVFGSILTLIGAGFVASQLPLSANYFDLIIPGLIAICSGLLTVFTFALPALGSALATDLASLFRSQRQHSGRMPRVWWLATFVCATTIVLMVLQVLPDKLFGVAFLVIVGALLLFLDLIVRGISRIAKSLDNHPLLAGRFVLKLALAHLYRPGSSLRTSLLSLGSALTLLVACTLVVASPMRSLHQTIPEETPALVLYDILNDQVNDIVSAIEQLPVTSRIEIVPLVGGRITALKGRELIDVSELNVKQRHDSLQDRYKLSYRINNIDSLSIVEGSWWSEPVGGLPKLAMEDREAGKLGLQVGDQLSFAIEGHSLEVELAAIYSQKGFQTRFWFEGILSNGALDSFIHRHDISMTSRPSPRKIISLKLHRM
jgi:putative ABC transport system permease protein